MCSVARGKTWAGRMLTSASSAWNAASYAAAISAVDLCSRPGLDEHPVLAAIELVVAQVADVGDVLDVEHVDAVVQQHAPDQVRQQVAPQVADVGVAVDGRAARVHPDATRLQRLDGPHLAGQRVAQSEGHRGAPGGVRGVGQRRTSGVHPTRGDQSSKFVAKGPNGGDVRSLSLQRPRN